MKNALVPYLFTLFAIGVFGADDVVSVMEGDSVTLHTGLTEIHEDDVIEWRFNGTHIAILNSESGEISMLNYDKRNKWQLDRQTGDLKIKNIRTADSGFYELDITSRMGSLSFTFSIRCVADPRSNGVTIVSVTEGDSVVLHADVTEIQKDDDILWRFRNKYVIAKKKKDEDISVYDDCADGIFKGRLHLNHQTGNIIVSDIRFNTSGLYEFDVKKRRYTTHKSFNVTLTDKLNRLSVKEGVKVTLESGVTELDRDDLVQWRFEHEDVVIAKINKTAGISSTFTGTDERLRDGLELDHQTGSLTITNTRTKHAGLYHLDITSNRHVIFRKFILSVCAAAEDHKYTGYIMASCFAFGCLALLAAGCIIYFRIKRRNIQRGI